MAQYGDTLGFRPLREWVAQRLSGYGIAVRPGARDPDRRACRTPSTCCAGRCCSRGTRSSSRTRPTPGCRRCSRFTALRRWRAGRRRGARRRAPLCAVARRHRPRLAILTPTLHNPSGHGPRREAQRQPLWRPCGQRAAWWSRSSSTRPWCATGRPRPPWRPSTTGWSSSGRSPRRCFPGLRVGLDRRSPGPAGGGGAHQAGRRPGRQRRSSRRPPGRCARGASSTPSASACEALAGPAATAGPRRAAPGDGGSCDGAGRAAASRCWSSCRPGRARASWPSGPRRWGRAVLPGPTMSVSGPGRCASRGVRCGRRRGPGAWSGRLLERRSAPFDAAPALV